MSVLYLNSQPSLPVVFIARKASEPRTCEFTRFSECSERGSIDQDEFSAPWLQLAAVVRVAAEEPMPIVTRTACTAMLEPPEMASHAQECFKHLASLPPKAPPRKSRATAATIAAQWQAAIAGPGAMFFLPFDCMVECPPSCAAQCLTRKPCH